MIVAGVMSGTSADGINVALVRIRGNGRTLRFHLLVHQETAYPAAVRQAILSVMNAGSASVADLSRLNFLLGELYANAVLSTQRRHRSEKIELVGCHGQTIYHQGEPSPYLGKKLAATWQTGEGAVIAARVGVPVVSDFRPSDIAAGGKGAPLVPFLDYLVYHHPKRGRILQNIGGIANLTAIPAGATAEQLIAFDTGPGNMVMDACMEQLYGKPFDHSGKVATRGTVLETVVAECLNARYFRQRPPKTAGREEFGREFVTHFLKRCVGLRKQDIIATVTALTARSIGLALQTVFQGGGQYHDYVVAGGGAKNTTLMNMLHAELANFGLKLQTSDDFGIPSVAKEAIAFALLAYETWHRWPSNVPSATCAKRPAILGKISYG